MCEEMGGYRNERTWEDTDVRGYGRILMCGDVGGCRCVMTWEDSNV